MTHEEAKNLKLFQIVRYIVTQEECKEDPEFNWCIPYCGKLAIVTQKIIWPEDNSEEIHLVFPKKSLNPNDFYDSIEDLQKDFEVGHNISFAEGFDITADSIDKL